MFWVFGPFSEYKDDPLVCQLSFLKISLCFFFIDPVPLDFLSVKLVFHLWFPFNPYFYSSPHLPPSQNYHGFFLFANIISFIEEQENRCTSSVCFLEQVEKDKDSIKVVGRMQKRKRCCLDSCGMSFGITWEELSTL